MNATGGMMPTHMQECLDWIDTQRDRMVSLVERWASINSGTFHRTGVEEVARAILPEFSRFAAQPELLSVPSMREVNKRGVLVAHPLGPALSLRVRPAASRRVLLAIHMDTVYDQESEFQQVTQDDTHMYGPGVADAKGGIAVLLVALETLERCLHRDAAADFGWEVLLNSDEEIGSPGSVELLRSAAQRNHLGLLFEPALPDGNLAGNRKGSANFHFVCHGKSAHAGRHFEEGINAIAAAADLASRVHSLNGRWDRTTLNVSRIEGGGPMNMVPDVAVVRVNIRYSHKSLEPEIERTLTEIEREIDEIHGIRSERYGTFTTPPKVVTGPIETMIGQVIETGRSLGLDLNHRSTGGVCDGNRLA
ncbi:MAG: hydrolase, partial [Planctomycetes bacterium]|nr:hydrolase [Planctomycetota bacterium]